MREFALPTMGWSRELTLGAGLESPERFASKESLAGARVEVTRRAVAVPSQDARGSCILAVWLGGCKRRRLAGLGSRQSRLDRVVLVGLITGRGPRADDSGPLLPGRRDEMTPGWRLSARRRNPGKRSAGQAASVVDQVCLVARRAGFPRRDRRVGRAAFLPDPDRRARLDVTLPARVSSGAGRALRWAGSARRQPCSSRPIRARPMIATRFGHEQSRAVARAWSSPSESDGVLPDAGLPPAGWGHAARRGPVRTRGPDARRGGRTGRGAFSAARRLKVSTFRDRPPGRFRVRRGVLATSWRSASVPVCAERRGVCRLGDSSTTIGSATIAIS